MRLNLFPRTKPQCSYVTPTCGVCGALQADIGRDTPREIFLRVAGGPTLKKVSACEAEVQDVQDAITEMQKVLEAIPHEMER